MKIKDWAKIAWKHKIRTILIAVVLVVAALVIKNKTSPEVPSETATVTRQNLTETITAEGIADAQDKADLYFAAPAKIAWMGVKKGDQVNKYQTLATLDKRSLEVAKQKALLNYQTARWTFESTQDKFNVSGRNIDQVPNLSTEDKRTLQEAQFDLDKAVADVDSSTLAMENSAISAPFNGIVAEDSNLKTGENMTTADIANRFIRVINPDSIYFRADIDEVDFGKIMTGQKATITFDAFPGKEWQGTINQIDSEATKNASGAVKVQVRIALNEVKGVVPNLNGEAIVTVSQKENVLTLPKKFVTFKGDKAMVLVMSGKKIIEKEVKTGMTTESQVEITSGLNDGDKVVLR